jgi:hypothetical protein
MFKNSITLSEKPKEFEWLRKQNCALDLRI